MNRGAEILGRLVAERGAQLKLARRLELDPGHVSRVARGLKVPGLTMRRKLLDEFGIAMELWDQPPSGSLVIKAGDEIEGSDVA